MAVVSSKKKDELTGNSGSMSVSGGTGSAPAISGVKLGSGGTAAGGGGLSGILQSVANTVKNSTQASAAGTNTAAIAQPAATGSGLQGLSTNTQKQLQQAQQGYTPSAEVTAAMNALQSVMDQKPQGYESKYTATLDNILQQITNPQGFKYSFDGDALFNAYKDMYTQQGKQASLDAMGQAAGLTGGYGNSYGQMVGQQQYQQNLQNLYGIGMDLYDRAYQRYRDDQSNLYNQLGAVQGMDETDYGRYRDLVGDWQGDRDYYTGRYDTLSDRDYGRYSDNRNYWTDYAGMENSDWWTGRNYDEGVRQYDLSLAEQQRQNDMQYAYNYVTAILANGQMPSEELLALAGLSKSDAKKLKAQIEAAGGGGKGSTKQPETKDTYSYKDAMTDILKASPDSKLLNNSTMTVGEMKQRIAAIQEEKEKKKAEEAAIQYRNNYEAGTIPMSELNKNMTEAQKKKLLKGT